MCNNDIITSVKDSKRVSTGLPFSPDILIEHPNIIENTIIATMFWRENNFEKSSTVNTEIVLSSKETSSESSRYSSERVALMASPSSTETSLKGYAATIPIKTDTKEVIMNTSTVVPSILPTLLGWLIFAIEVDIVRNIKGTIIQLHY